MHDLFGIPMNSIMLVLVAALGIAVATVLYVVIRTRIMFFIGLRNIPRRPAQTVLIIIGLMLSTLIISAAFTTGDTVDHSLSAQSYELLGHVDEIVEQSGESDSAPNEIDSVIPPDLVEELRVSLEALDDSQVDGFLPVLEQEVPVINQRAGQSEPSVNFVGLDATALEGFPDVISTATGAALNVGSLGPDEVYMNDEAADALAAEAGDTVQVFIDSVPHEFGVVDVVESKLLTGVGDFGAMEGMVTRLDTLQEVLARPGDVNFIAVSNSGGVRDGYGLTDSVTTKLEQAFAVGLVGDVSVKVYDVKRDLVDSSEEAGNFMATFFVIFGLFSIAAGMLLIVMIFVMLAAERKSELGMARAIGTKRGHLIQMFLSEGMAYNMLAAAVGAALGVGVSFVITRLMARIFSEFDFNIEPYVTPRSLIISYSLGVVLTFVTVVFASWRVSNLNIVRAIRDTPEPPGRRMGWRWLVTAVLSLVFGALLVLLGLNGDTAFAFALGATLLTAGFAVLLRFVNLPERPVFTAFSSFLLVFWGLVAGGRLEFLFGPLNGDVEMFFLSGIAMVSAATFAIVYNADLALTAISQLGGLFGPILPALRTAVAYPLASKFRTGMTLAMISLVIFALTMMSTMNTNFNRLFLAESARGGWDVIVRENPSNPIPDLDASLRIASASSVANRIQALGRMEAAGEARIAEVTEAQTELDFERYLVFGVDDGFVTGSNISLSARAEGFESDEAVWQALSTRTDVAVVDRFTVEQGGFTFDDTSFSISGIDPSDKVFKPVTLALQNPVSRARSDVEVIGVIDFGTSATFFGVFITQDEFEKVYGAPILSIHFVGLDDPGESKQVARDIEAALLPLGVQADSLKKQIEDAQALTRNFFLLMQSFMGLGLFVGIAAVGVIAFRTVVERRQQIGMLRAIGYKRNMVALSFLLESSFVTLLAIASGVALAIWLSFFLLTSDEFPEGATYVIPWRPILFISALTFGASLLMTYIPSRQAASIPTAEALRYE